MRQTRLRLLLATILTVNLIGVGVLVTRVGRQRPLVVSTAASTKLDTSAPEQLPGDISVAPDAGPGSGRPSSFLPGAVRGDGTVFAKYDSDKDGTKIFKLDAAPYTWNVAPGVKKQAFAFNGTVPGPTIRVIEGDKVRVVVTNHLKTGTAVHWHGMVLPNKMDGVPGVTQEPIPPGGTMTYEFVAVATGTHWYHSHWDGDQVGKGLYGSLEVVPHTGDRAVDRDYRLFVGDTNLGFVINGRTYPGTEPLKARVGEKIRIRLTPTGELSHPFHLHGQPFQLVAQDGFDLPQPVTMDTLLISTAQTFDIITVALAPGRWMFHCHIFSHMHAPGPHAGHAMAGLVTTLDVEPAVAPAVPPVNGVTPAVGVPAAPVTPGPDNPPGGDKKDDRDKKGGGGGAPAPPGSPPGAPPAEPPHH
jgi:FtsP/CotA-like multicopper oxidase with cupredoxin domain